MFDLVGRFGNHTVRAIASGLLFASVLAVALGGNANAASYFVRPFVQQFPAALIDGLQQNGPTQSSQNFGTDFEAEVDLNDGSVSAYVNIPGALQGGQAGGSFGERVQFNNAAGTMVDFAFAFEGDISVSDLLPGPLPTGLSISVFATLFVHDVSTGATWNNFTSIGGELIGMSLFDNSFGTPGGSTPTQTFWNVDEVLSGSLLIGTNSQFDVFASLSVAAASNNNDVQIELDFSNTGTFGIDTAPGVTYTSDSGVFLDATGVTPPAVVPLPPALPLFAGGLGLIGLLGWCRKRKAMAVA